MEEGLLPVKETTQSQIFFSSMRSIFIKVIWTSHITIITNWLRMKVIYLIMELGERLYVEISVIAKNPEGIWKIPGKFIKSSVETQK